MHLFWLQLIELLALLSARECFSALTNDEINVFLDGHNGYRQQLLEGKVQGQPPAALMPMMVWNEALTVKAKEWADNCTVGHDSREHRLISGYDWVGQNVAAGPNWRTAMSQWWNEYRNYNYSNNSCSGVCGHYTQMAWANSVQLGCYKKDCSHKPGFIYGFLTVCNYAPGGNLRGQRPYIAKQAVVVPQTTETTPSVTEPAKEYNLNQFFLEGHNTRRQLLKDGKVVGQPRALEMPHMVWNEALATKAKEWAENCTFGHDSREHRLIPGYDWVGQNVAAGSDWHTSMGKWWDENYNYRYSNNSCSLKCGHYTQMAWADSVQLGCYKTDCTQRWKFPPGYLTVCNYAPGGNLRGQKPYKAVEAPKTTPAVTEPQEEDKWSEFFLTEHNKLRELLRDGDVEGQPRADKMPNMMWNSQLATKAKGWADQCKFGHDSQSERKIPGFDTVGQNIVMVKDWRKSIDMWWDEHIYYNYDTGNCIKQCDNYTQMAWANSIYVGCGVAKCPELKNSDVVYFVVCDYAPGGNLPGEKPYQLSMPYEKVMEEFFLQRHNEYRGKARNGTLRHQPQAKYLPDLGWNRELYKQARETTALCNLTVTPGKYSLPGYPSVGQVITFSEVTPLFVFFEMTIGFIYYDYDNNACKGQIRYCNNYKQVMYAKSVLLGCHYRVCRVDNRDGWLGACNYAEGADLSKRPYEKV